MKEIGSAHNAAENSPFREDSQYWPGEGATSVPPWPRFTCGTVGVRICFHSASDLTTFLYSPGPPCCGVCEAGVRFAAPNRTQSFAQNAKRHALPLEKRTAAAVTTS